MDKQKIIDFLKTETVGVIATVDTENNKPEAAVVAFSETENGEIIFGTFNDSRKFLNLQKNPHVSFVIGYDDITVQYEGVARLVDGDEAGSCLKIHLAKNPGSKKYVYHKKQRFFKVKPLWIRYSDFSFDPERVFEVVF